MRLTHLVPGLMLLGAAMLLASPESLTNPVDEDGALQWTSVANAQSSTAVLQWKAVSSGSPGCNSNDPGSPDAVLCVAESLKMELGAYPSLNVNSAATSNGKIQGYQLLEHIFQVNGYSAAHITSWLGAGSKLQSTTNPNGRPSWCGILVNAIYLKASVAVSKWQSGTGVAGRSDFRRLKTTERVAPGDTCALVAESHHVLVLATSGDGSTVDILQGNGNNETVTWPEQVPLSKYMTAPGAAGCYRPKVWN